MLGIREGNELNVFAANLAVQRLPNLGNDGSASGNNRAVSRIDIVQRLSFQT